MDAYEKKKKIILLLNKKKPQKKTNEKLDFRPAWYRLRGLFMIMDILYSKMPICFFA